MARVPLLVKAYQERSEIASAQKTINLYAEFNQADPQAPSPVTYYLTPGYTRFSVSNNPATIRGMYRTSIGTAYVVIGTIVYSLSVNGALAQIGIIPDLKSQVYFADNGLAVVLVDGVGGWAIDINSNDFGPIVDMSFYGAAFVIFLDTFFVFNRPGTNQFYISLSNVDYAQLTSGTSFDPLDIAAKSGSADPIVAIVTIHKELWLIGALTTEVWIGTGAADFYFQLVQGAYIQHGCIAPYSVTNQDVIAFWLMQDRQGKNIVVQGTGYDVNEISTPFLINEFNSYETTDDAIGYCFQISDHAFYCLIFPTANKTWLYDLGTKYWNEWNFSNLDTGQLERHRSNCYMYAFEKCLIGDYANGIIYELSSFVYMDDNVPIIWIKTGAHSVEDFNRVRYISVDADIDVATTIDPNEIPEISLSWSDDRGKSYGFPVMQSLGKVGQTLTTVSWNRLGQARDRIFKLQCSAAIKTSLNGYFVTVSPSKS